VIRDDSSPSSTATAASPVPLPSTARASEKLLAKVLQYVRAQIRHERKACYDILESTQKRGLDITPWLE